MSWHGLLAVISVHAAHGVEDKAKLVSAPWVIQFCQRPNPPPGQNSSSSLLP